jgi:hypothetical protein
MKWGLDYHIMNAHNLATQYHKLHGLPMQTSFIDTIVRCSCGWRLGIYYRKSKFTDLVKFWRRTARDFLVSSHLRSIKAIGNWPTSQSTTIEDSIENPSHWLDRSKSTTIASMSLTAVSEKTQYHPSLEPQANAASLVVHRSSLSREMFAIKPELLYDTWSGSRRLYAPMLLSSVVTLCSSFCIVVSTVYDLCVYMRSSTSAVTFYQI